MQKPALRSVLEGSAVIVIGASILLLLPSQTNPIPGLQTQMSPALIPMLVAIGLVLTGSGIVLQSALGHGGADSVDLDRTVSIRIVTTMLLLLAYTYLFPRIGFVVTSAVFVGFFTWFFGARDPVKIGLLVVLAPVAVWLFFEKLFRIPLPAGLLV